ncbi:uncharacterized protein LOC142181052 [Nicotiana tabacum]|uniref:Uncharacterized protein LOC142181052 n=1 Tax=Nicotiana tabacum TaxID=4097 RepID=A0AC58UIH4_TOBAC
MILNIDLEKVFDRIEWSFVKETLHVFNYPIATINLIMFCVSSSSISVLVNGDQTKPFNPTRGIRQSDPLSPYLFILCMEILSRAIERNVQQKERSPISISKSGPKLSHLFFADELIIRDTAPQSSILSIPLIRLQAKRSTLANPESFLVLTANPTKWSPTLTAFIQATANSGKYLGFPIFHKGPTNNDFQFIIDNLHTKMIWLTRNNNLFNNKKDMVNYKSALEKAIEYITISVDRTPTKEKTNWVKWTPPLNNTYKLNTDGDAVGNPEKGGLGGVFRDASEN